MTNKTYAIKNMNPWHQFIIIKKYFEGLWKTLELWFSLLPYFHLLHGYSNKNWVNSTLWNGSFFSGLLLGKHRGIDGWFQEDKRSNDKVPGFRQLRHNFDQKCKYIYITMKYLVHHRRWLISYFSCLLQDNKREQILMLWSINNT